VGVAGPVRFCRARDSWDAARVERDVYRPLDARFGATMRTPWYAPPSGYEARHLEMDNGDLALFAWTDSGDGAGDAYWLGNTETPEVLWRTDKCTFEEAPYPVARWAQRELLATLRETDPWLADYEYVSWFFLPVFFSKDGRETTREFFRDHAAGFPDSERDEALAFYEEVLATSRLDDFRYTMASKLGTSERMDLVRMRATMGEFNAAKLLSDSGYAFTPEVALDSGHALDFRAHDPDALVEVTRPEPPTRRRAGTPAAALRETVDGKRGGQLAAHGSAVLLVDCSSFRDDEWLAVAGEEPDVGHEPAVVYWLRPDGRRDGYTRGDLSLSIDGL
jgi:hypothetical protein